MAESWHPLLPATGWVLPPCREPPCGALGVRAGARASSSGWTGEADKGPAGERHSQPRGLGTRAALWDRGQWVAAGVDPRAGGGVAGPELGAMRASGPPPPQRGPGSPPQRDTVRWGSGEIGDRIQSPQWSSVCWQLRLGGAPGFWPIGPHSLASLPAVQTLGSPGEGGRLGAPGSGTPRRWWLHGTPRRWGRGWLEPEGTGAKDPGCLGERIEDRGAAGGAGRPQR